MLLLAATALVWGAAAPRANADTACNVVSGFELDGNMNANTCSPAGLDWDSPDLGAASTSDSGFYNSSGRDGDDPSTWTRVGTASSLEFRNGAAVGRVVDGHYVVDVMWERTPLDQQRSYALEIDDNLPTVAADGTPQPHRFQGMVIYFQSRGSAQVPEPPVVDHSCTYLRQDMYTETCTTATSGFTGAVNTAPITSPFTGATIETAGFVEVSVDISLLLGIFPTCSGSFYDPVSFYLRSLDIAGAPGRVQQFMAPLTLAPISTCEAPPMTSTALPGAPINLRLSDQTDTVTVGTPENPGIGRVTFSVCAPEQVEANGGDCSSLGVAGGVTVSVEYLDGNGQATSGVFHPLEAGKFCWQVAFEPAYNEDHYYPDVHTNSTSECFMVVAPGAPHELLISQFRTAGPNGPADDFVELYNNTANPVDLTGWTLRSPAGTDQMPGSTIPAHGYFLVGGSSYSLGSYAAPDHTPKNDVPAMGGLELAGPDGTVSDAVGFTPAPAEFREGSGLAPLDPSDPATRSAAWVRNVVAAAPVDTDDNASDFTLVMPDAGLHDGVQAARGAAGPHDLAGPVRRSDIVRASLLDPSVGANASPNRLYDPSTHLLTVRRTLTNTSATQTLTALRVRMVNITVEGGGPTTPHAWLRWQSSTPESVTTTAGRVEVDGLSLIEPPDQPEGGGLNSAATVRLPKGGLAPGQSVSVSFTFAVDQGGAFRFVFSSEALATP